MIQNNVAYSIMGHAFFMGVRAHGVPLWVAVTLHGAVGSVMGEGFVARHVVAIGCSLTSSRTALRQDSLHCIGSGSCSQEHMFGPCITAIIIC